MNINVNSNTGIYDLNQNINSTQIISETPERQKMAQVPEDMVRYVKAGDTFSGQITGFNEDGTVENQEIGIGGRETVVVQVHGIREG